MPESLQFVIAHGYAVLFAWVLGEQLGLPIPSVPMLLLAGAMARAGQVRLSGSLVMALAACLIADLVWYELGRRRGTQVLNFLCRIALEPASCVRRTQNAFERQGPKALLFAKFIPGLSTASNPVAGASGMPVEKFLLFDGLGSLLWAGVFQGLGYAFSGKIEQVGAYASRLGNAFILLIIAAFAAYIVRRWVARRRFEREFMDQRIEPEELKQILDAGEPVTILDLRHPLDFLPYPQLIPGAIRFAPSELQQRHDEIPRDREIVLYCT
jgi:membrane protein DedA with SNARE-associated domain